MVIYRGLIPAHAGKTARSTFSASGVWAHPRSRGENPFPSTKCAGSLGSSPLTRGKLARDPMVAARPRLIPAHAGKTSKRAARRRGGGAHPRSRGENQLHRHVGDLTLGSSPLTRGKLGAHDRAREPRRLIPAHAGKTLRRVSDVDTTAAHPRSRGENILCLPLFSR